MFFQRCFVVFFHDERADPCARDLIKMLKQTDVKKGIFVENHRVFFFSQIVLVQSKSYVVDENSAERLFSGSKNYTSQVKQRSSTRIRICRNERSSIVSTIVTQFDYEQIFEFVPSVSNLFEFESISFVFLF